VAGEERRPAQKWETTRERARGAHKHCVGGSWRHPAQRESLERSLPKREVALTAPGLDKETLTPTTCCLLLHEGRREGEEVRGARCVCAVFVLRAVRRKESKKENPSKPQCSVGPSRRFKTQPFPFPAISVSCSVCREQWASQRGPGNAACLLAHWLVLHIPARNERP
jgi:hypothetical protein